MKTSTTKLSMLSVALVAAIGLGACQKSEPAADAAPAADAMAPADSTAPADESMASPDAMAPTDGMAAGDAMAAGENPMVGGAAMSAEKDIVDNASASADHTTLVAAVKAAGLVDTLKGAGPFTVFAPTNEAFDALPAGTVDGLLKPEAKADLTKVLTYHVVPGNIDAAALTKLITDGGGSAKVKTVQGEELTAKADGGKVTLTDAKGNVANVTIADVRQSNGVIHVIDKVLLP